MDIAFINNSILIELENRKSKYITHIHNLYNHVSPILENINKTFPNYTLHNIGHSVRVLQNISDLISDKISMFAELELVMIIYCSLLHDIGMFVADKEKKAIIEGKFDTTEIKYSAIRSLTKDDIEAIQELIRPIHGERSEKYINENLHQYMKLNNAQDIHFNEYVAKICRSHNESYKWIYENLNNNIPIGENICNLQFIAVMLRLGDILDFDSRRAPKILYDSTHLGYFSDTEWQKHFFTKNTKKIFNENGKKHVIINGLCNCPKVFRNIIKYINYIDEEIESSSKILKKAKPKISLEPKTRNLIKPKGFQKSDLSLFMDYSAITNLLMNESLYGNKEAALREIIQNSIDACTVKSKVHTDELNIYTPKILISFDQKNNIITIQDNGIGMNRDVVKKYFLTVGKSYYNSKEFKFKGISYNSIGKYGIGFLSCFMLSNKIIVETKSYEEKRGIKLTLEKFCQYVIWNDIESQSNSGTKIILEYDLFMDVFKNINNVINYLEKTFLNDIVDISIKNVKTRKSYNLQFDKPKVELPITYNDLQIFFSKENITSHNNSLSFFKLGNISHYLSNGRLKQLPESYDLENNIKKFVFGDYVSILCLKLVDSWKADKIDELEFLDFDIYDAYDAIEEQEGFKDVYILLSNGDPLNHNDKTSLEYNDYEFSSLVQEYNATINENEEIFLGYSYNDFCNDFNHAYKYLEVSFIKHRVVTSTTVQNILFLKKMLPIEVKVYSRGIFVRKYTINLAPSLFIYYPSKLTVNINTQEIMPNVARDNFESSFEETLRNTIGKAILTWNIKIQEDRSIKELLNEYRDATY